ncbi:MAG: amidohydrolase [Crocinitomicaceae bacterium]|nr:amidohydrolase [Crocinitomicaceae bacterium]
MTNNKKSITIFIYFLFFAVSCSSNKEILIDENSTIYFGGDILTMESDNPVYVESIVIESGTIAFTGSLDEAIEKFPAARKSDLNGQTLMPGFIDGHCHFAGFPGQSVGAQILPPPDATVSDIPTLISVLKEWSTPENIKLTGWIFGLGFDDSVLEEKRFPNKFDLDKVSEDIPVMIIHISGHFASVNSKALEMLNINSNTLDPEGGVIRRVENSNEPNGVLEELAAIPYMPMVLAPKSEAAMMTFLNSGQEMAMSYGYTTAQEGRAMPNTHAFLEEVAKQELLKIDIVSYIDYSIADSLLRTEWYSPSYKNHYRIGGMKITLDGSPQGRTAWRTQPYLLPPDGAEKGYKGYPAIPNDLDVIDIYEVAYKNQWQILTHANGDAAMDQMIRTMSEVQQKYGKENRRDVLIHGQYVRDDQLDEFQELGVVASLFPLHTYYWGDWHAQLIGDSLGSFISPTRAALDKKMNITIHTDAPVALPNLMRVIWTATTRVSRSGKIIGADQRLTVYEALKCITDWSAYQHFEEKTKGTLTKGKIADLVLLNRNPLKVDLEEVKEIIVMETIKNGKTVFKR